MLLKNSITALSTGNCLDSNSDYLNSVFEMKWTRRRSSINTNTNIFEYDNNDVAFYNITRHIPNIDRNTC